jgi:L-methionine (R)-S-oxide reductase
VSSFQTQVDTAAQRSGAAPAAHDLLSAVDALLDGERDWLANLANVAALLPVHLPDINWAGFYLWRRGELVLGPFQGRPACVRIAEGRGVCGQAATRQTALVVKDVHDFPGHIACDSRSRSEIVVPLLNASTLLGVLDIDSPSLARFDDTERVLLEEVARHVVRATDWPDFIGKDER